MTTLREILKTTRSPKIKLVKDSAMDGAKFALMCGDEVYVSPAMFKLLGDDLQEALFVADHISVIPMVAATAKVREIENPKLKTEQFVYLKPDRA